ncbi:MAG: hypothetical protein JWM89_1801 [Acidimicrobiales bacterium]|nr:hypothetical protein [Acidimicrobiales bacterium]
MTTNHPTNGIIATVDGTNYRVDFDDVTGEQVIRLHTQLGVTPATLAELADGENIGLPELVAVMMLALEQQDLPADPLWLARHVTLGSEIAFERYAPDEPTS